MSSADILAADSHLFPLSDADVQRIAAAGLTLGLVNGHEPAQLREAGPNARALIAWGGRYDGAVFDALPDLKVLARGGAGYDNIDLSAAAARGIVTTYVPGGSDDEVAEHTVALLLALARKIPHGDRAIRAGGWPSSAQLAPMRRVRGARLGLIGFGRIAQAVAWRARALGVDVTAFDPFRSADTLARAGVERATSLELLLAEADVVSLHLPGGVGDPPLIGARELAIMKPTALLINTARGSLVDTDALVDALRAGRLAGAGLDVMTPEPPPSGHPFLSLDNVILTPHSAAFSVPALSAIRERVLDNVLAVLGGQPPITPIPSPSASRQHASDNHGEDARR